jgi:hypothetical protein
MEQMNRYRLIVGLVAALASVADPRRAVADSDVILARAAPDVVLIWRANDAIADAVGKHLAVSEIQRSLALAGLERMVAALPADAASDHTVTLKIVYFNDGGYDPNYRIATVSGVRRIGELSSDIGKLRRSHARWQTQIERSGSAPGLSLHFEAGAFDDMI